jgi:acyl-CoA synthetase (AMP-forming)/AMP-acid ligase II
MIVFWRLAMILNMGRILRQLSLTFSNNVALVNIERDRRLTYSELHEVTNRASNMLRDKFGLGERDVYATLLENDNMSLLHVWMAKSLCTGLLLGMRDSFDEHCTQIEYVKPRLIFIEKHLVPRYYEWLKDQKMTIICMDEPDPEWEGVYYFWAVIEEASPSETNAEYVVDDCNEHIYLLRFTGGTTSTGKCVMFSVSNFFGFGFNSIQYSEVFPYDSPKALLSPPITHAAGGLLIPVFFKGGTILTMNRPDVEMISRIVEKEKVDLIYTVPTVLYRMLELDLPKKYDLSSLKTIRYGGSPISPSKLGELVKQFGMIFVQAYGSTETWTPPVILGRKDHGVKNKLNSVGRPVPGIEVKISDDKGNEMPIGENGEIYIRGFHITKGYYKDPNQTKENFTENCFWKSGDIGYMDQDGFLYLVDRKKDMIISGGFNVYAKEVEDCLNSHPAVRMSAVVGIPDEYWGEAVYAEVVLKEKESICEEELIDYCKQHIAKYKAPKSITFVDELPLSSVGKVLRRAVKEKLWEKEEKRIH